MLFYFLILRGSQEQAPVWTTWEALAPDPTWSLSVMHGLSSPSLYIPSVCNLLLTRYLLLLILFFWKKQCKRSWCYTIQVFRKKNYFSTSKRREMWQFVKKKKKVAPSEAQWFCKIRLFTHSFAKAAPPILGESFYWVLQASKMFKEPKWSFWPIQRDKYNTSECYRWRLLRE